MGRRWLILLAACARPPAVALPVTRALPAGPGMTILGTLQSHLDDFRSIDLVARRVSYASLGTIRTYALAPGLPLVDRWTPRRMHFEDVLDARDPRAQAEAARYSLTAPRNSLGFARGADGSHLVFPTKAAAPGVTLQQLYLADATGRPLRRLGGDWAAWPAFSPDGAFVLFGDDDALTIASVADGTERRIEGLAVIAQPWFSADGKDLYVVDVKGVAGDPADYCLWHLDGKTLSDPEVLTCERETSAIDAVAVPDPQGKRAFWMVSSKDGDRLSLLDLPGGETRWLERRDEDQPRPAWLTDDGIAVFDARLDDDFVLIAVDLEIGREVRFDDTWFEAAMGDDVILARREDQLVMIDLRRALAARA
jgi:hypothetical protein